MVDLFLRAEPRRRSELLHGALDGAALVAAIGRLGRVSAMGAGRRGGRSHGGGAAARADTAVVGRGRGAAPALRCAQHRPQSEAQAVLRRRRRASSAGPQATCCGRGVEPRGRGSTGIFILYQLACLLLTNGFIYAAVSLHHTQVLTRPRYEQGSQTPPPVPV